VGTGYDMNFVESVLIVCLYMTHCMFMYDSLYVYV